MRTPCQAIAEHTNWCNWSLKNKRAYLETKGYVVVNGALCRAFRHDEYANNGWADVRHLIHWEFDNTLNRRRAIDNHGRTCIDWQYITTD